MNKFSRNGKEIFEGEAEIINKEDKKYTLIEAPFICPFCGFKSGTKLEKCPKCYKDI